MFVKNGTNVKNVVVKNIYVHEFQLEVNAPFTTDFPNFCNFDAVVKSLNSGR